MLTFVIVSTVPEQPYSSCKMVLFPLVPGGIQNSFRFSIDVSEVSQLVPVALHIMLASASPSPLFKLLVAGRPLHGRSTSAITLLFAWSNSWRPFASVFNDFSFFHASIAFIYSTPSIPHTQHFLAISAMLSPSSKKIDPCNTDQLFATFRF